MKYLALFATALCALGAFPAEPDHGTLIAHRGGSDAPENTLAADERHLGEVEAQQEEFEAK